MKDARVAVLSLLRGRKARGASSEELAIAADIPNEANARRRFGYLLTRMEKQGKVKREQEGTRRWRYFAV